MGSGAVFGERRGWVAAVAVALVLAASAAGCTKPTPPGGPADRYIVTGYVDGRTQAFVGLVADSAISLELSADGRLSGVACNHYGGSWTVSGSAFHVSNLYSSQMACLTPEGVMEQESQYLAAIAAATRWQRDGAELILASGEGRGRPLVRATVAPDPTT